MLAGGERAGMGTNLEQKECKVKGGVPSSARKQILGYKRLMAQNLCQSK